MSGTGARSTVCRTREACTRLVGGVDGAFTLRAVRVLLSMRTRCACECRA